MATKKYDFSSLEGLEKVFNDAVKEMAYEYAWKIENLYESAIEAFYNDYNPLYYDRTGSTFLASSGYNNLFIPRNVYGNGHYWTAQITVGASNMPGDPYRANKHWVFKRTFEKGIHGLNAGKIFGKQKIRTFQRVKGKKTFEAIYMTGYGDSYRINKRNKYYTGNVQVLTREMTNMSPTPSSMMNTGFKKITRRREMKKVFNDILNSKLV